MKDHKDEILDKLLARLEAGESIEECLVGFPPAEAEELRASLQVIRALQTLRHVPPPRAEAKRRLRAEMLARAAQPPAKRGGQALPFPAGRRWAAWAVGAITVLFLLAAGWWQYHIHWQTLPALISEPPSTQLAGLVSAPTPTMTLTPAQPSPTPPASRSPTPPALSPTPQATRTPAASTAAPASPTPSPTPSPVLATPPPAAPAATPTQAVIPTATFTPLPTPTPPPPTAPPPPPPPPTSPPAPTPTATATEPPPTPTPAQTSEPEPTFVPTLVPASESTATPAR